MKRKTLSVFSVLMVAFMTLAPVDSGAQNAKARMRTEIRQETIPGVLKKVEKVYGYRIMFSYEDLNRYVVSRSIDASNIDEAMCQVIKDLPLNYKIRGRQITVTRTHGGKRPVVRQQVVTVGKVLLQGTVCDDFGGPLPGVVVRVGDGGKGTSTDNDGHFSLELDHGNTVTVSFSLLGMKTEKYVFNCKHDLTDLAIRMKDDARAIDEVVVTGLMNRDARNFTGNASVYNGEELKVMGHQNIIKSLALLDPSVAITENTEMGSDPNTMPKIRFRGESSFQGFESIDRSGLVSDPNQPLFILDGYETTMSRIVDLDMNRVESVTVLKDAAAAAIYGARAANGVIVVKTKKPKEGKLRLSYNLDMTAELPDLSSYDLLNARENMQLIDKLGLYRYDDGTYRPEYNQIARWIAQGVDTDWMSKPLRNAFGTRHSLNLQGGDSRMRYGIDLNYGNSPGVMKESKRDNYGIGVDLSYNMNDKVLFDNYLSVNQTNSKESPYGKFSDYTEINPYFPIYDPNGRLYKYYYYTDEYGKQNNVWGNVSNIPVNPLYEASVGNKNETKMTGFNENFSFDWRITREWRLNGRVSYTHSENNNEYFLSPNSATYTDFGEGMSDLTTEQQKLRGRYTHTQTLQSSLEGNAFLSYTRQLGKHFMTASVGGSLSDSKSTVYGFTAQGFGSDNIGEPAYANGYEQNGTPVNAEGHSRLASFFASANYSYNDRYLLDLSYRLDGSSQFGNRERTAPFYSAGIGWNAHNEKFIRNLGFVNVLRLSATYGEVGSVNFSPYQAKDIYNFTSDSRYDGNIGAILAGMGNENLKW